MRENRIAHCPVGLGVVLKEEEAVTPAEVSNALSIGTTTIEMDNHQGSRAGGDGLLNERVINLQGVDIRLHQYRPQAVLGDGKNGGYVGVGWHDNLIAVLQPIKIYVRAQDECQGIQAVAHTNAVAGANVVGIVLLKAGSGISPQIPAGVHHAVDSLVDFLSIEGVDAFQRKMFYHR